MTDAQGLMDRYGLPRVLALVALAHMEEGTSEEVAVQKMSNLFIGLKQERLRLKRELIKVESRVEQLESVLRVIEEAE